MGDFAEIEIYLKAHKAPKAQNYQTKLKKILKSSLEMEVKSSKSSRSLKKSSNLFNKIPQIQIYFKYKSP
jgi:hypothetical protein